MKVVLLRKYLKWNICILSNCYLIALCIYRVHSGRLTLNIENKLKIYKDIIKPTRTASNYGIQWLEATSPKWKPCSLSYMVQW
jgi:hypothetical protein